MKQFRLEAKTHFYAEDIDDAFARLAEHFKGLAGRGLNARGDGSFFIDGSVEIEPTGVVIEEAPQEAPMKCLECGGKGFIEYNHGLLQVQCAACHGIGVIADGDVLKVPESTTVVGAQTTGPFATPFQDPETNAGYVPPEEATSADVIPGTGQPDKPARKPYTRKPTKPRKRPKGR